jgi:hypothetical protein
MDMNMLKPYMINISVLAAMAEIRCDGIGLHDLLRESSRIAGSLLLIVYCEGEEG